MTPTTELQPSAPSKVQARAGRVVICLDSALTYDFTLASLGLSARFFFWGKQPQKGMCF